MDNNAGEYSPAFAPLAIIAAVAFGVWAYITRWAGISLVVLEQPAVIPPGLVALAVVSLAACVALRATWRATSAVAALYAGFAFLWLVAQAAPAAIG